MVAKVKGYLEEIYQWQPEDVVVVGVSGGADSVCLLCVLREIFEDTGVSLHAVHVNHNLRAEAIDDQHFVEGLCARWELPCHSFSYDVTAYGKMHKISAEEAGRRLRYQAFDETAKQLADKMPGSKVMIAVAHTMDDNAETVLLNLFRGSGLKGLGGIPVCRDSIIRPLLCVRRREIETWLTDRGIGWREDVTNGEDDYTRNRIRHQILPAAEKGVNEKATEHMSSMSRQLALAEDYLADRAAEAYKVCVKECGGGILLLEEAMLSQHPYLRRRLLLEAMRKAAGTAKDLAEVHVRELEHLFSFQCGRRKTLAYGMTAVRTYEGILLSGRQDDVADCGQGKISGEEGVLLNIPGETVLPGVGIVTTRLLEGENINKIPKDAYTKWLDYDTIKGTVYIRTRREGDYLGIDKAGNTQKLKRYFVNEKIPEAERDRIPLLADQDHILWVIGYRCSHLSYINSSTKKILEIQYRKWDKIKRKVPKGMDVKIRVMISEEEIDQRIREIALKISEEYQGKELHIVCILKGSVFFASELAKRISVPVTMDFMAVSSYGNNTVSKGDIHMKKDLEEPLDGKHVLVIEDIIDTGKTLSYLMKMLKERKPASLKLCTLLDKPDRRTHPVNVDYTGFVIPDEFVVGYGLDYAQKYRNLPYIGVVEND